MTRTELAPLVPFLLLLFLGTMCSAMIVPFMGFFLIETLGRDPWVISVYSIMVVSLTLAINRQFGRRIDGGGLVFPLIGIAAVGFFSASLALALVPSLWIALSFGVLGFGISSSAVSTMFSVGGGLAERRGATRSNFNTYMRATTSTAWMVGPATAFVMADQFGGAAVFKASTGLAMVWIALWWWSVPRDISVVAPTQPGAPIAVAGATRGLWMAAGFVFCLSSAHSLTFSALPLFYVREVGLPSYAPGLAFSIKTFVEVLAIFSTPYLSARFGVRRSLMGTTALAVCTIVLLSSVTSFAQMMVGAALEGLYYGLYASLGISFVQSHATARPAQATALYWNTLMVSGLLAGPAVGLVAQAHSFQAVIQIAAVVAACALLVLWRGAREAD